MEGKLRTLHGQVDMASIDTRFTEAHRLTVDHGLPGFLDGLRAGAVVSQTAGVPRSRSRGSCCRSFPCSWWSHCCWRGSLAATRVDPRDVPRLDDDECRRRFTSVDHLVLGTLHPDRGVDLVPVVRRWTATWPGSRSTR